MKKFANVPKGTWDSIAKPHCAIRRVRITVLAVLQVFAVVRQVTKGGTAKEVIKRDDISTAN